MRNDKKVDVKATLSVTFKKQLYFFAELCNEPVKEIAERFCILGLVEPSVIDEICKWLRRDYRYGTAIAIGHMERPKLKVKSKGETGKVSMRFNQKAYDKLAKLAYALDITPSSAAAVLIRVASKDTVFMEKFIYDLDRVDEEQREMVKEFAKETWGIRFKREEYNGV